MTSVQSAMNYLKRKFSDTNFSSTIPNGYMVDTEEEDKSSDAHTSPSQSVSSSSTTNTSLSRPPQSIPHAGSASQQSGNPPKTDHSDGNSGGFFASLASGNPLAALKPENNDKYKTILVVDDQHTDWQKYFKGKKLHGEYNLRVEQAEFKEISLSSHSIGGVTIDINCFRNGSRIVRSFKPDFLLIRQISRSMVEGEDHRNLIIGLKYGGVPSINSLHSQYNFMDKPWIFAQLIRIQKRLGREKFPLVEQTYYPSHKQMVLSWSN